MKFQGDTSAGLATNHSLAGFIACNLGNYTLSGLTKASSLATCSAVPYVRGQQFVDDFFLQESNSESTSYATQVDEKAGFGTEFVSTTAELLSTERGAQALFKADPTRAALFFYLANRPLFDDLDQDFRQKQQAAQQADHPQGQPQADGDDIITLSELLHIV